MLSRRSVAQKQQFKKMQNCRHLAENLVQMKFTPKQYCLAVLSEGLGETKARRFLAKLNIKAPSSSAFYKTQNKLLPEIERITDDSTRKVRENLPPGSIFGIDCI